MEEKRMIVGKITGAHGIKGELKVFPMTDDMERFEALPFVYIRGEKRDILSVRYQTTTVLLTIKGVETRNDAEALKQSFLEIDRDMAVKLPEGRFFIVDLIGLRVELENGEVVGTLADVIQAGGNDVYIIKREGKEDALIPAIRQVIKHIDIEEKIMVITPMEGSL